MSKYLIAVVALLSLCTTAQAAKVRFEGGFVVTGKSGTCSDYDPTGLRRYARFQPSNVGDNDNWSAFALFDQSYAESYQVSSGNFGRSYKTVIWRNVFADSWAGDHVVKVKFTSQSPKTILASTSFVEITGSIVNFDQQNGCVVSFRMALTKRLE